MKRAFAAWKWSLGVVVQSPATLLGLTLFCGLWGLAAYQWLWLPESSVIVLLVILVWAIAQILVAIAVLTGTTVSASEAAALSARNLALRGFLRFTRRQFAKCALMLIASFVLALVITQLFGWVDAHALEVASFLSFQSQKPVSHQVVEGIFWVIENLLWIVIWGFLASFLIILLRAGWQEVGRQRGRIFKNCCYRASFLTGLASAVIFGGVAYLLAEWHPKVNPGFWDYSQMVFRLGLGLSLLVAGWLFWMLSLARFALESEGSSSPEPSHG